MTLGTSVDAEGPGFRSSSLGIETLPVETLCTIRSVVIMRKGKTRRSMKRLALLCGNILAHFETQTSIEAQV